ncbi:MAG: tetratricopeptide repeat protein [Bacteroidetes bacterium]|nr:tetratricopeptide repeat protein [Bacteroidota bacterium]
MGNHAAAELLYIEAKNIHKEVMGKKHPSYLFIFWWYCLVLFFLFRIFFSFCSKFNSGYMKKMLIILTSFILLTGCLTVEFKEYKFELNPDKSGTLTIKFINIRAVCENKTAADSVSDADYNELVNAYLNGTRIEDDFANAHVISKRLFEEDGKLCGETVLKFDSISQVNIFQYDPSGPLMLMTNVLNEKYYDSNGNKGPDYFPAVFWDKSVKTLILKNAIATDIDSTKELLGFYRKNKN